MDKNGESLMPRTDTVLMPDTFEGTVSIASHFAKSGFFADSREASQAVVKIMAGREMGFGPFASMTGIYVIKGRIAWAANLMAAAVKRTGRYTYRVTVHSDVACEIDFYEAKEKVGTSRFTIQDAQRAKLAGGDNYQNYPRNMLFARAMSNGVKWYCPDVFGGPVYTPEEIDDLPDEPAPASRVVTPESIAERIAANTAPTPEPTVEPVVADAKPPSYDPWGAIQMVTELSGGRFDGKMLAAYFGEGVATKSALEAVKAQHLTAFQAGYDRLRQDYKAGKAGVVPAGVA